MTLLHWAIRIRPDGNDSVPRPPGLQRGTFVQVAALNHVVQNHAHDVLQR